MELFYLLQRKGGSRHPVGGTHLYRGHADSVELEKQPLLVKTCLAAESSNQMLDEDHCLG